MRQVGPQVLLNFTLESAICSLRTISFIIEVPCSGGNLFYRACLEWRNEK